MLCQLTWIALPWVLLLGARVGLLLLLLLLLFYAASYRKVIAAECRAAVDDGWVAVKHGLLSGRKLGSHRRRLRRRKLVWRL
jgi:hypothetical protein